MCDHADVEGASSNGWDYAEELKAAAIEGEEGKPEKDTVPSPLVLEAEQNLLEKEVRAISLYGEGCSYDEIAQLLEPRFGVEGGGPGPAGPAVTSAPTSICRLRSIDMKRSFGSGGARHRGR